MKTPEEILNDISTDTTTKGRVKFEDAIKAMNAYAMEVAEKAWDAAWERAYQCVGCVWGVVLAPSKDEYMKQLFPDSPETVNKNSGS